MASLPVDCTPAERHSHSISTTDSSPILDDPNVEKDEGITGLLGAQAYFQFASPTLTLW